MPKYLDIDIRIKADSNAASECSIYLESKKKSVRRSNSGWYYRSSRLPVTGMLEFTVQVVSLYQYSPVEVTFNVSGDDVSTRKGDTGENGVCTITGSLFVG